MSRYKTTTRYSFRSRLLGTIHIAAESPEQAIAAANEAHAEYGETLNWHADSTMPNTFYGQRVDDSERPSRDERFREEFGMSEAEYRYSEQD